MLDSWPEQQDQGQTQDGHMHVPMGQHTWQERAEGPSITQRHPDGDRSGMSPC